MLPYTLSEIRRRVTPVAEKYRRAAVCLFGSYARGEATAESDIDLLVDLTGSTIRGLNFVSLYEDLSNALEISVDLVTVDSLEQPTTHRGRQHFREAVQRERMQIYSKVKPTVEHIMDYWNTDLIIRISRRKTNYRPSVFALSDNRSRLSKHIYGGITI